MFPSPSISGVTFNINVLDDAETGLMNFNGTKITADDTKLMMLKLKKARLETQVACTRTQLLLAEMELRLVVKQLHQETRRNEPKPLFTPESPQAKRPRKLVKLLSKVFKPSSSNSSSEEPDTTASNSDTQAGDLDPGVQGGSVTEKKKNVSKQSKKKSRLDKLRDKENRDATRATPQEIAVDTSIQVQHTVDKTHEKNKSVILTIQTGKTKDKEGKEKKNEGDNKKQKESKSKSRKRKHEKVNSTTLNNTAGKKTKHDGKGNVASVSKVDKPIKLILKKSHVTQDSNNNVPGSQSQKTAEDDNTVEFNIGAMFHSPNDSDDKIKEMETTGNNNANSIKTILANDDAMVEIPGNIFVKQEIDDVVPEVRKEVVKLVDVVLDSLQDDLLFKELRDSPMKKEKSSSICSMETLLLDSDESYKDVSM